MSNNLENHLKEVYGDEIAIINGKEFVSLDIFKNSVYNLALSEAIIGVLVMKFGNFELTEEEVIEYMSEYAESVAVENKDGKIVAVRL